MREEVKAKLDKTLLNLYKDAFRYVVFPVKPEVVLGRIPNCRLVTYEDLSMFCGCSVADVIRACDSADGCTHYDPTKRRYLVAINMSGRTQERIRWTIAHELGHIVAGHFLELASMNKTEASPSELPCMEEEADYFAATFLAPFQAIKILGAQSAGDVQNWFNLSQAAAERRWLEFKKPHKPIELDYYLVWSGLQSFAKKPHRIKKYYPIDILSDEQL